MRKIANLEANVEATALVLSEAEVVEIGALVTPNRISGLRYG